MTEPNILNTTPRSRGGYRVNVYKSESGPKLEETVGSGREQPKKSTGSSAKVIQSATDSKVAALIDQLSLENPNTNIWPRRLLHVKSLTSFSKATAKNGQVFYQFPGRKPVTEPSYSIISYTWGRYRTRSSDAPALEILGPLWDIPAIDADKAFSVDDFQKLLLVAAGDNEFVWVDVACINQEEGLEKTEEVGNQVAIFNRASLASIWLHQLTTVQLKEAIETFEAMRTGEDRTKEQTEILRRFCEDPWFSSLWTLQEAYLRKDAVLVSKTAETVSNFHGKPATLQWLLDCCDHEWAHDSSYMSDIIGNAGLDRLLAKNPVVLLAAARHRTTSRPLDRIFGIMQVFGLKLGAAKPDQPERRLQDLEVELSEEINIRSPALAQTFVHISPPSAGYAWRLHVGTCTPATKSRRGVYRRPGLDLTQVVPPDFYNVQEDALYEKRAKVSFEDGKPVFVGHACSLESLVELFEACPSLPTDQDAPQMNEWMPYMNDLGHSIYVDNVRDLPALRGTVPQQLAFMNYARPLVVAQDLVMHFPAQLKVLLLGKLQDGGENVFIGIIAEQDEYERQTWKRIAICTWSENLAGLENFACNLG